MSRLRRLFTSSTLLKRLLVPYLLTSVFVGGSTIYNVLSLKATANQLNAVYAGNAQIYDLSAALTVVLSDTERYLLTRSSSALESYYRDSDLLLEKASFLNTEVLDDKPLLLQRDIRRMIDTFTSQTAEAVAAKRGRDVENYTSNFEAARQTFAYIESYAAELNAARYQANYTEFRRMETVLDQTRLVDIAIMAAILVINFVIIVVTAVQTVRPIARLAERADQVAGGNLDVPLLTLDTYDEVRVLGNAFNAMIASLRTNLEQIRQNLIHETRQKEHDLMMENLLQVAQLKNLQAQINPHFLFNVLNTGAQLAMLEGADRTSEFVGHVADFYRSNIRLFDRDVTLAQEVKMVEDYIYIQKTRFTDRVRFELDIDATCLDLRMPGLILQPLVENALVHGLGRMERDGRIVIRIARRDPDVEILISDNGQGMDPERIRAVLGDPPPEAGDAGRDAAGGQSGAGAAAGGQPGGSSIGLINVVSRLRLYYGKHDTLEILSGPDRPGTTVRLLIPNAVSAPESQTAAQADGQAGSETEAQADGQADSETEARANGRTNPETNALADGQTEAKKEDGHVQDSAGG